MRGGSRRWWRRCWLAALKCQGGVEGRVDGRSGCVVCSWSL